ncbi:MAG: hypothetical protein WAT39_01550, partial [Planctomycetota bacterium]
SEHAEDGAADPGVPPSPAEHDDIERFKGALRSLVRTGVMTRDEARAAWQTRLRTLADKT